MVKFIPSLHFDPLTHTNLEANQLCCCPTTGLSFDNVAHQCWWYVLGTRKTTFLKLPSSINLFWFIFREGSILTFQVIECGFEGLLIIEDPPSMESLARSQSAIDLEVGRISHDDSDILEGTFLSVLGDSCLITPDLEQDWCFQPRILSANSKQSVRRWRL